MRTLAEAAAPGAPYDWAFASHVVEHVPDLVGWLQEVASLVAEDGVLVVAVPDRRYCFDAHRPPTTTGQLIQAHQAGDVIPSVRAVHDHHRYAVRGASRHLWKGQVPDYSARHHDLNFVKGELERVARGEYVDCHVWTYTDSSFAEQIEELRELGLVDWWVETVLPVAEGDLEFYAVLRRDTPAEGRPGTSATFPDWLAGARDLQVENAELRRKIREQRKRIRAQRARIRTLRQELRALKGSTRWKAASALAAPVAAVRRRRLR
jgi:hypothetical protein